MQKKKWMMLLALFFLIVAGGIFAYIYIQTRAMKHYTLPQNTFIYSKGDVVYYGFFDVRFIPSLNWIKNNTNPNEVIVVWWKHGHMIRGYSEREVIAYAPSPDIMELTGEGVWDEKKSGNLSSNELIRDIAIAYTTTDPLITKKVMHKHNSSYILFAKEYVWDLSLLLVIAGEDLNRFLTEDKQFTIIGRDMMAYRLSMNYNTGLRLVYEDDNAKIYKLVD